MSLFKKLSLAQLVVAQAAISAARTRTGDLITSGNVVTSTDPNVRAEAMVKLGNDFATLRELDDALTAEIVAKETAAKEKAAAKAAKTATATPTTTTPATVA